MRLLAVLSQLSHKFTAHSRRAGGCSRRRPPHEGQAACASSADRCARRQPRTSPPGIHRKLVGQVTGVGLALTLLVLGCGNDEGGDTTPTQTATCSDGVKNGSETGLDCGGSDCNQCAVGGGCQTNANCLSGYCKGNFCAEAKCTDGEKNGVETDVDCGGDCGACGPGQACIKADDCGTGVCESNLCLEPQALCQAGELQCKDEATAQTCEGAGGDAQWVDTACASATEYCVNGQCVCKPQCGQKTCGDDGCGGACGTCQGQDVCQEDSCVCVPSCAGKECGSDGCGGPCDGCPNGGICSANGLCDCAPACDGLDCGPDGCGGECGACDEGVDCSNNGQCGCTPDCEGKTCDYDGCGGVCNGCLDLMNDDGDTDTAFGYNSDPGFAPQKIACLVRYELPFADMKLTRFTAGWMYGLYNLAIPFDLVYVKGSDMNCQVGDPENDWYTSFCGTKWDKVNVIAADVLPKEPYTPMDVAAEVGEVVLPETTVFIGAVFAVDEYPIYVCPVDQQSEGGDSFMMPVRLDTDDVLYLESGAMKQTESNNGSIPFRIRVQQ